MQQAQIAPIDRHARTRRSADSVWPLRGADGLTFAERKACIIAAAQGEG